MIYKVNDQLIHIIIIELIASLNELIVNDQLIVARRPLYHHQVP